MPEATLTQKEVDRGLGNAIIDGAFASMMSSLAGGVFLTGLALPLGATNLQIGILASLPLLGNLGQLPSSCLIERSG